MAEEQDDLFWWHNYLSFLEWNSQWYAEHGELHHPEDAFHVHEIVVGKVEKEDVFKDPDTIVNAETWNDPTWRGILHLPQPIMCGGVLCPFICLRLENEQHGFWCLHIHDTPMFEECPSERCFNDDAYHDLRDLQMFAARKIGLLLHLVPSFINEKSWSIESHSFMHPLRRGWVHELFQMVHHGRFLLERVIGGTPEHGLEYAVDIGLKGKSTIQDVMQLVSVGEWLPSIPELADGAKCKLTVEQLVAHQARHTVTLADNDAECKALQAELPNPYEDEDEIVQWIAILQSRATIIQTFITQGKGLLDIAVAQEVMSSQPDDVQEHVDTDGNVTKKHKTM